VLGLSGGIDSAVVAILAQEVFEDNLEAIMLPSPYSSESSIKDAKQLCDKFKIKYQIIHIDKFVNSYLQTINTTPSNTDMGNFCARIRMSILYDQSSKLKALVLGTSNKTELLLGYSTIFGDIASALNPIGDLYKSEIFEFGNFLDINDCILSKPPSADLFEGQSDENDLGYTYEQIDAFLIQMIDNRIPIHTLKKEFDENMANSLQKRIFANQFKRMMPIIAKISNRSIGHDFLYPRDINI